MVNGLAHTNLHNRTCYDDDTELLNSLHTFLKKSEVSPQNPSTIHCTDTLRDGSSVSHIAEKVKKEANNSNMSVVSLPGICYLLSDVMSPMPSYSSKSTKSRKLRGLSPRAISTQVFWPSRPRFSWFSWVLDANAGMVPISLPSCHCMLPM